MKKIDMSQMPPDNAIWIKFVEDQTGWVTDMRVNLLIDGKAPPPVQAFAMVITQAAQQMKAAVTRKQCDCPRCKGVVALATAIELLISGNPFLGLGATSEIYSNSSADLEKKDLN